VWHLQAAPFHLLHGSVAVVCFFVISGFYMAMVLTEKYDSCGQFYLARLVRLYPAYIAMLVALVAWYWLRIPDFFSPRSPFLWMMNLFVFGQDLYELMNNIVGE